MIETIPAPPGSRSHVPDGVEVDYGTPFPTAGLHSEIMAEPGFYADAQSLPRLVHALEHGDIVIYSDETGAEALRQLQCWSEEFHGHGDGGGGRAEPRRAFPTAINTASTISPFLGT